MTFLVAKHEEMPFRAMKNQKGNDRKTKTCSCFMSYSLFSPLVINDAVVLQLFHCQLLRENGFTCLHLLGSPFSTYSSPSISKVKARERLHLNDFPMLFVQLFLFLVPYGAEIIKILLLRNIPSMHHKTFWFCNMILSMYKMPF